MEVSSQSLKRQRKFTHRSWLFSESVIWRQVATKMPFHFWRSLWRWTSRSLDPRMCQTSTFSLKFQEFTLRIETMRWLWTTLPKPTTWLKLNTEMSTSRLLRFLLSLLRSTTSRRIFRKPFLAKRELLKFTKCLTTTRIRTTSPTFALLFRSGKKTTKRTSLKLWSL